MPDFEFTSLEGKRFTVTGPQGVTPEQAWAVLQQHLTAAGGAVGGHRDVGPADWGAIRVEPQKSSGPLSWGAIPVSKNSTAAGDVEKNAPRLVRGAGRAFARGAPIVGGLLNKADAATDAALSYALNPLFDEKDQLKGSLGERYRQALDTQNRMDEAFHEEHPVLDTAAELGGVATTALGAKALGLTAKTLPGLMAAGAGSGGAIGLLDAEARGEDPLAAGGVGLATRVVSSLARPVTSAVRGALDPVAEAAHRISGAIARVVKAGSAGLTEPEFLSAQSADAPVNLMDAGGAVDALSSIWGVGHDQRLP